jgi:hypothetical protein
VGLLTEFDPNFQLGSENTQFWGPMGTAIIAGLTFGTFLTLVIVPVMYSTFDSISEHLGSIFGRDEAEIEGDGEARQTAYAAAIAGNGARSDAAGNGAGSGVESSERAQ